MAPVKVLDTAALIVWSVEMISGGIVLEAQRSELSRVAPERLMVIEATELVWSSPNEDSVEKAREWAIETGDIAGLSEVDLGLLALAIELEGTMYTDDYRLQNLCTVAGITWSPVATDGINSVWTWEIRCSGCGFKSEVPSQTTPAGHNTGECDICGSPLQIKKRV